MGILDFFRRKKEINNTVKQTLIPSGGTTDWLINAALRDYNGGGYTDDVVCNIPISSDCYISVKDHLQFVSYKGCEEFCTSLQFFKGTLDHPITTYYPYGSRFDEDMLLQIGAALNGLINKARDLSKSSTNQKQLALIQSRQRLLLDLLITGTENKNAVSQIMEGITLSIEDENVLSK